MNCFSRPGARSVRPWDGLVKRKGSIVKSTNRGLAGCVAFLGGFRCRRFAADVLEGIHRGMALVLVFATVTATMPVRADETWHESRTQAASENPVVDPAGHGSDARLSADPLDGKSLAGLSLPSPGFFSNNPTGAVKPVLECVNYFGGTNYVAWFGYQNANSVAVTIPVGTNNKFSPTPQDRGQTTVFQPGTLHYTFKVSFNGTSLVWTLKGPDNTARTVTASSSSPRCAAVANAGPAQTVNAGSTVTLDGTGSYDPTGNPITYKWSFVSKPSGSTATLSNTGAAKPTFVADKTGTFTVQLIVNNGQVDSAPSTVCITVNYSMPIANAGPPQTVSVGATVHLDGSASYDPGGLALTYNWSFVSKPNGSAASLSGANTVHPTFVADKAGTYKIQLTVCNGHNTSAPSTVTITAQTYTPVANAGSPQTVYVGATVQLNGSASYDPGGHALTYSWSFVSRPSGSAATLSVATTVNPTFVADKSGSYTVQLIVNNGTNNSAPSTVVITSQYATPIANAGPPQTVYVGTTVQLDGTGSSDPTGLPLTYQWSFVSVPAGSAATLSNATASKPTFVTDKAGTYKVQLVVNNGHNSSTPSTVVITSQNQPPVANAGPAQTVFVGATVHLDGTGSYDPAGLPLTYQWSFVSVPAGSSAVLSGATTPQPTFVVDKSGTYNVQLIVNNGIFSSAPSTVQISTQNSPPVANAGPNQTAVIHSTVHFDGSGSTDEMDRGV